MLHTSSLRRLSSRPWLLVGLLAGLLALLLVVSPSEATLGSVVKIVYLHGSLERVSTYAYFAGAVLGLAYLAVRAAPLVRWAQALGEIAIVLWLAEFVVSLPAQWLAWGGITLSEPRVSGALWILALTTVVYIVSRWMGEPAWLACGVIANALVLALVLHGEVNLLHPFNPITGSDSADIKVFYAAIVVTVAAIAVAAAWWRVRSLHSVVSASLAIEPRRSNT